MIRRIISTTLIAAALATALFADDAEVVELRVQARYLSAPATIRMVIAVQPDEANRTLHVEMDGEQMFRASVLALDGAAERRVHEIQFSNVPPGHYTVLAAVRSARGERGRASERVFVMGAPERQ